MSRFDWDKYNRHRAKFNRPSGFKVWWEKWGGVAWFVAMCIAGIAGVVYEAGWRLHWW